MGINKTLLYLSLILFCLCRQAAASTVLHLDGGQERIDPRNYLEWFVDEHGGMGLEELLAEERRFKAVPKSSSYPRGDHAYWFRLRLSSDGQWEARWLLELAYTQLDHLDLYRRVGDGPWQHIATGDYHPISSREVRHPHPVFRVPLREGVITELVLRVQSSTSIAVPLTLWREEAFARYNQDWLLINGLSYGMLLALVFYNLFLYPTVRDPAYLWFAFYLGSFVLFQFSLDGFAALYFWPRWPALADRAVSLALWLCMGAGLKFTQHIGQTRRYAPRLHRLFSGLSLLAFLLAFLVAISGPAALFPLLPPLALLVVLLVPLSLWIAWRGGYRPARFALFAYFPQLPGAFFIIARTQNWVEPSFWSDHLYIFGGALSSILLSFALADRINAMRKQHAEAQQRLLESEREAGEAQRRFSRQLIEAQDRERRRVAVELHDGVGQNLSFLANALRRLRRQEGVVLPGSVDEVARDAVEEVRAISHQLHPHLLDKLGLVAAIEAIAGRTAEQAGIQCRVTIEETALPCGADLHLYRIAQEALNNVVRHSNATRVEVSLRKKGPNIEFSVVDNGRGTGGNMESGTGLGLESIAERAKLLGGSVTFEDAAPHGFKLRLTIPAGETV